MPKKRSTDVLVRKLRAFGLSYPGAHTKSPWPDHLDLAVNDKTFAYMSLEGEPFGISCKLPESSEVALLLPFTEPTEYGLGKSGWVTARFEEGQTPPVALLEAWIDESYRAQAPKRLVAMLDGGKAASKRAAAPLRKRRAKPSPKRGKAKTKPKPKPKPKKSRKR